ncbi:MAG: hypothetical protein HQL55_10560, partial [Magnetococcales bacterium]|nr:hypothetical protein [Magnetococcales bacterium]
QPITKFAHLIICLQKVPIPSWLPNWLLEQARIEPDDNISLDLSNNARYLFEQPPMPPYPLEQAFSFAETNEKNLEIIDCNNITNNKFEIISHLNNSIDCISNGTCIGELSYLANIYLEEPTGFETEARYSERLIEKYSVKISQAAENGFSVILKHQQLPTLHDVAKKRVEGNNNNILAPIVSAAMTLKSKQQNNFFNEISNEILSSAIALHLSSRLKKDTTWLMELISHKPELVANTCFTFWLLQLQTGRFDIPELDGLAEDDRWSPIAKQVTIPLLEECSNLSGNNLQHLLIAGLRLAPQELLTITRHILDCSRTQIPGWNLWAGIALLLEPTCWERLKPGLQSEKNEFEFLDFISNILFRNKQRGQTPIPHNTISPSTIRYLAEHYCDHWPFISDLTDIDSEKWQISNKLKSFINLITEEISEAATIELESLANNVNLLQWRNYLLHSLAQHQQKVAEETIVSMELSDIVNTISNKLPGSPGDLHALIMDHIRSIANELRNSSSDGYKAYWNTDSNNKPTFPKVEDNSRDRLLEALQTKFSAMPDVHIEPEGRYAEDNRSDISIFFKTWKIPIEIKQESHVEIWNAANSQLITKYIRDPASGGYGIYLVFWYNGNKLRKPPKERAIPHLTSAKELEIALQKGINNNYQNTCKVIVIDVYKHSN